MESPRFFFLPGDVKCSLYRRTRDAEAEHHVRARSHIERLWAANAQFVDKDAPQRATENMPSVWWELYLADTLARRGKKLVPRDRRTPRNQGPDLLAENPRVWIEAVMSDRDETLAEPPFGMAYAVPDEAYLLRLTSAIETKSRNFLRYQQLGYVKARDAAVIAISAAKLTYRFTDLPTPRIVSTVFAAGPQTLLINKSSGEITDQYLAYRESIPKTENASVRTDMFLRPEYSHISALLYSPCDWIIPADGDFILVHNPLATVPLCRGWLGIGRDYWLDESTLHTLVHPNSEVENTAGDAG